MMTFGSLFSGVGGLDLGLERAGMRCNWQVEIDDYARAVLEKHWPEVPKYRDVRYFLGSKRWRRARSHWRVDLIAGGFPCQDISQAGKRVGIEGSRSGLWSEFARIIRLLRPRYVLVENVDALAVRGMGRVLGDLAALGFDAEWDRIPAAAVGAPHLRWRIFILAYANPMREPQPERRLGLERRWTGDDSSKNVSDAVRFPNEGGSATDGERADCLLSNADSLWAGQLWREQFEAHCQGTRDLYWPSAIPPVCGVADGVPSRMERLRGLGNAVVPQIAEWIGRRILEWERTK